jgi:hypothetical protein
VDEENLFWISKRLAKGTWCVGGQRTWLAPELGSEGFFGTNAEDWKVPPELDPGEYRLIETDSGDFSFRSDFEIERLDGRSYSLSIVRSLRIESVREAGIRPGLAIRIDNTLINRSQQTLEKEIGLWSILQAPAEVTGTFLIPINKEKPDASYRLYFGELPPDWMLESPGLLYLKARAGKWHKLGIPASAAIGTVALLRSSRVDENSILTILRCEVDLSARYIDKTPVQEVENGDVLQCYNSPDAQNLNFCELEAHAPAVQLAPGAEQFSEIEVLLFKDTAQRISSLTKQLVSSRFGADRLFTD